MKIIKTYENFISNNINENWLTDKLKNIYSKIKNFLSGTLMDMVAIFNSIFSRENSWKYNLLYMKKTGDLNKHKIQYHPYGTSEEEVENMENNIENIVNYVKSKNENFSFTNEAISFGSIKRDEEDSLAFKGGEEFGAETITGKAPEDSGVANVNHEELRTMLLDAYNLRKDTGTLCTTFIWGKSGIGKTEAVKSIAKELKIDCISWELATAEPTDLKGAAVPDLETKRTEFFIPKVFPEGDSGGIIFFDEINRANTSVLNGALNLLLTGKLDQYKLPEKWLVVCAGNWPFELDDEETDSKKSSKVKQAVKDLDAAARTRLKHINLVMSARATLSHLKYNVNVDEDIIEFLTFNKKYIHKSNAMSIQLANPRNWERLSDYLKTLLKRDPNPSLKTIKKYVAPFVGAEIAGYFVDFLKLKDSIDLDKIKYIWTDPSKAPKLDFSSSKYGGVGLDRLQSMIGIIANLRPFDKLERKETDPEKLKYVENIAKYVRSYVNEEIMTIVIGLLNQYIPNLTSQTIWIDEMKAHVSRNDPKKTK